MALKLTLGKFFFPIVTKSIANISLVSAIDNMHASKNLVCEYVSVNNPK